MSWSASKIGHEVVLASEPLVRRVTLVKVDAVLDVAAREVLPRLRDRRGVEVDAVHVHQRICAGDGDARPARTARDVGDPRRRLGEKAFVNVGNRRQPFATEQVGEHRPRERRLTLDEVLPVVLVGNPGAGPERFQQFLDRLRRCDDQLAEGARVVEARLVEKDLFIGRRQAEASLGRSGGDIVHLEDAGRRLLLEPLARIPLVDAGGLGEAARGERPRVGKRAVQPQPIADVDTEQIHRAEGRLEEATHERVTPFFGRGYGVVPVQFSVTHLLMFVPAAVAAVPSMDCNFASASGLGG